MPTKRGFLLLKSMYQSLLMALGLLYWAVAGLLITLMGSLLYKLLPKRYSLPCGRFLLQKAFLLFINYLKATGLLILDDQALTSLALQSPPLIIAPNHLALWDAVFIIAKIPDTVCIMKSAIVKNPFLGGGARLAGYISNGSTSQMVRSAAHQVKAGAKLLLFPEGTRTQTQADWLNPLQGTVALVAKHSHAPVMPVYIRSNSRFFEKGWPLYRKPIFPVRLSFEVGEPLYFQADETVQDFTRRLTKIYQTELAKPHPLRRKPATAL